MEPGRGTEETDVRGRQNCEWSRLEGTEGETGVSRCVSTGSFLHEVGRGGACYEDRLYTVIGALFISHHIDPHCRHAYQYQQQDQCHTALVSSPDLLHHTLQSLCAGLHLLVRLVYDPVESFYLVHLPFECLRSPHIVDIGGTSFQLLCVAGYLLRDLVLVLHLGLPALLRQDI